MILTILIIVDLVGHGEEGGVLLQPVLHVVQQVLVSLHHLLLQQLTHEKQLIFFYELFLFQIRYSPGDARRSPGTGTSPRCTRRR